MQTDLQGEAQIRSAEVCLLAIVAAVQVVEKMEPQAAWLQSLEGHTRTAEKKLADCEKAGPPPSQIFWRQWRKDTRQAAAACPVRRGARARALAPVSVQDILQAPDGVGARHPAGPRRCGRKTSCRPQTVWAQDNPAGPRRCGRKTSCRSQTVWAQEILQAPDGVGARHPAGPRR
ncbi:hypothetical protein H8959_008301, partial [Pygathrix nigripes]